MFVPRLCRMLLFNLFAESRLLRYIRAINPNIIHSNVGPVHIGCHIARKLYVPHVWHLREYQTPDFNMRPFPSTRWFMKTLVYENAAGAQQLLYRDYQRII